MALSVEPDGVSLLRLKPGMQPSDRLEVVGTMNREHVAYATKELAAHLAAT